MTKKISENKQTNKKNMIKVITEEVPSTFCTAGQLVNLAADINGSFQKKKEALTQQTLLSKRLQWQLCTCVSISM